jgi:hypothetical protein
MIHLPMQEALAKPGYEKLPLSGLEFYELLLAS